MCGAERPEMIQTILPGCIQEGESPPAAIVIPQADLKGKGLFRPGRGSFLFCVVGQIDQSKLQIRIAFSPALFPSAVVEDTDLKPVRLKGSVENADLRDAIVLLTGVDSPPGSAPVHNTELNAIPVKTSIGRRDAQSVQILREE